MCGVTRAPFNSNRSSCGIEVVVPFFSTRNSNTLGCVPVQYTGPIDASGPILKGRGRYHRVWRAPLAQEEIDEPTSKFLRRSEATTRPLIAGIEGGLTYF